MKNMMKAVNSFAGNFEIFDNLIEGVSVYEPVYDDNGKIHDFIVKYVNKATIEGSGNSYRYYTGKCISKLYGYDKLGIYFKIYEDIIVKGKNKKVKTYLPPLNKYYHISGFLIHDSLFVMLRVESNYPEKSGLNLKDTDDNPQINVQVTGELEKFEDEVKDEKRVKEILNENEEKFRLIFNNANDMISLSEIDNEGMPGKYIEINEVGVKRLGYSKDELLNMSPVDIVAPDKRVEMPFNAVELTKKGYNNFEIIHVAKNGRKIPVEINGHRINYKGRKVYLTVSRDITKRKQMANALKESEEKFREIFHNANDMITLHKMNENGMPGKFVEVNEVGCCRLGYTNEEFQNMSPVDIVAPDKRVEMANHAIEIWTNGYAKFEIVHVAKDGKRIPVEINTHIFKFRGETMALGISRDITERKSAEEKLKKLLDELSHLNEKSEQYIYATTSYLQEHLDNITDATKQLEDSYNNKLDSNTQKFIDSIADESEHLKHVIFNLLEYENTSKNKSVELEKSTQ